MRTCSSLASSSFVQHARAEAGKKHVAASRREAASERAFPSPTRWTGIRPDELPESVMEGRASAAHGRSTSASFLVEGPAGDDAVTPGWRRTGSRSSLFMVGPTIPPAAAQLGRVGERSWLDMRPMRTILRVREKEIERRKYLVMVLFGG